jgi:hypothetical protein
LESGQGDNKKFESIRINLRDFTWSLVCPRDPGLCWPGSLGPVLEPVLVSHLRSTHTRLHRYFQGLCVSLPTLLYSILPSVFESWVVMV